MKKAGVLLPVFSLPGSYGIGDFGKNAYHFIDLIKKSGLSYWQVLPLNPLDESFSPYQAISSFAGETVYIDLGGLEEMGLLNKIKIQDFDETFADYQNVKVFKEELFRKAYQNFKTTMKDSEEFTQFKKTWWLKSFCEFKVLYHLNDKTLWPTWKKHKIDDDEMEFEAFKQFIFFKQWNNLKEYANNQGIKIIGDLPFYVGFNSEDVYTYRQFFKLDENNQPTCVSGVPPDYFNLEGQRWNHPIYNWQELENQHFDYWIKKIKHACSMFDILRLDHFRAFDTYWEVDKDSVGAKNGQWIEAPGDALFNELFKQYPDLKIIVEDLGCLRPEVYELKDKYHLDGMNVLQFCYNEFLNHQIPKNCIFYTGTHDNNTLLTWKKENHIYQSNLELIEEVMNTPANIVIIPLQDFLELDDHTRINSPGTVGKHNWTWRIASLDEFEKITSTIRLMVGKTRCN
ncbi:MAG: 4-alpha-glucanotransferase [Erysipelotrichaceae bacterium]|nr:4-alpha-glucanotransferase [Erysipelotrichaceae bacterium]